MQFSKPMIELVYELRHRVPSEMKPSVKLANPDLLDELAAFYPEGSTIARTLIKELLSLAGPEWESAWQRNLSDVPVPRRVIRMYRGQISVESRGDPSHQTNAKQQHERRLVYRGQVIN